MKEDIIPKNAKGQGHGLWELYHPNGQLGFKCVFINGEINGLYEHYWGDDGKLSDKKYYL